MTDSPKPGLLPLGGEIAAFHLTSLPDGGWNVVIDGTGGDQLHAGPFTGHDDVRKALAYIEGICLASYRPPPTA